MRGTMHQYPWFYIKCQFSFKEKNKCIPVLLKKLSAPSSEKWTHYFMYQGKIEQPLFL